jgi:uncharacterized protein with von Willebrand factor type A (vWA) domain
MFEAEDGGETAAQRVSRTAGTEFECVSLRREKLRDILDKLATAGRKNPFRNRLRRLSRLAIVFRAQRIELSCERANRLGRIWFSDNLSKLLSAVRRASEIARLF